MDPSSLPDLWPSIIAALSFLVSVFASGHAVLRKRDHRSASGWVALIWLAPVVGASLYLLLGINRIHRRAVSLRVPHLELSAPQGHTARCAPGDIPQRLPQAAHLAGLALLAQKVTARPLLDGNRVGVLDGGAVAYPAMLQAITEAERSVTLSTYIFDNDRVGAMFVDALRAALQRGVEVRVLIDGVGVQYSRPPIHKPLRAAGVRTALFLPTLTPRAVPFLNLRNHRKTMVVDGKVCFTGGMNLREAFMRATGAARDLHFRVEGPVVAQLQASFIEDWEFATGEALRGERWLDPDPARGSVLARGVLDGPDESVDPLRAILLGAVTCARERVGIVTPYFLPDSALVTALNVAALRGVRVDIVIPERSNIRLVQWATQAQLWQNLLHGCRVHLSPPPFDHSKLMVVDDVWALIGSANWDPRSLRLNFELDTECYDATLGRELRAVVDERIGRARPLELAEVDARPTVVRLRDGVARLLSPYL